jgi:hypothetical protein
MASMRPSTDENLLRALTARAREDVRFRESLARVITAEPKYEAYVDRKKREGATSWLDKDAWEARVFGRGKEPKSPEVGGRPPSNTPAYLTPPNILPSTLKARPRRIFSEEETRHLPQWSQQNTGDKEQIFEQAEEAQPLMVKWLDEGKGIDRAIGAKVVRRDLERDAPIDLETPGPVMVIAPQKTRESATDKVEARYKGDWREGAVDLVRASIGVDNYDELPKVVEALRESGAELSSRPRNRFREDSQSGYRDMVLNYRLPNGHVMELQLHLKPILRAKDEVHPLYAQVKNLNETLKEDAASGGGDAGSETRKKVQRLNRAMRQRYDQAFSEALPSDPVKARSLFEFEAPEDTSKKAAEDPYADEYFGRYFEFDGLPVEWALEQHPKIHAYGDVYNIDDYADFLDNAVQIDEARFKELVDQKNPRGQKSASDPLTRVLLARAEEDPAFRAALASVLEDWKKEN